MVMLGVTHGLIGDFGLNVARGSPGYTPFITNLPVVQARRRFFLNIFFTFSFCFSICFSASSFFSILFFFYFCFSFCFMKRIFWPNFVTNVLFISFRFFHVNSNILSVWRNLSAILFFLLFLFPFFSLQQKFQIQNARNAS